MKNMINTTTTNDNMNNIDSNNSKDTTATHVFSIDRSYLHVTEYPDDNYNHIYGYDDNNHQLSKLQLISKLRIEDTIRNKKPIDTVSCCSFHDCCCYYIFTVLNTINSTNNIIIITKVISIITLIIIIIILGWMRH